MSEKINQTSLVLLHYSLSLTDNTVIESSFDDEPLEINMLDSSLPEGMMLALIGLKADDEQTLTLTPEQCFGVRDEDNIHDMPLSDFGNDLKPEVGLTFNFGTADDEDLPGTILSIKKDSVEVEVDFNHPLASLALIFSVKILEVNNAHAFIPNE